MFSWHDYVYAVHGNVFILCNSFLAVIFICFMSWLLWKYCCVEERGVTKWPMLDVKSLFTWCTVLPSDGQTAPVVHVCTAWDQEFTLPPPTVESEVPAFLTYNNRGFGGDDFHVAFQLWGFVIQTDCGTHTCTHTPVALGLRGLSTLIFILRNFCHCFPDSPTV